MLKALFEKLKNAVGRPPDFIIGTEDNPYLRRWWIIPRNPFFNIYLHQFLRDDDDRALHDHPWASCSVILTGGYIEWVPGRWHCQNYKPNPHDPVYFFRKPGQVTFRKPTAAHRIELHRDDDGNAVSAWTLFITGPKVREWGFHCPQGWKHWAAFVHPDNPGLVGPGCDDSPAEAELKRINAQLAKLHNAAYRLGKSVSEHARAAD